MPTDSRRCRSRTRRSIWHLYEAAIAGRDIYYDQRYEHSLEMRDILEAILTHSTGVDPKTLEEIRPLHQAVLDQQRAVQQPDRPQVRPADCTPEALRRRGHAAESAGATFPLRNGETLDRTLARLKPAFFDPDVDPTVTAKTPPPGKDLLTASANNLYVGLTMKDLEGYQEQHPLNSRLVKKDGKIVEEVYRVGGLLRQAARGHRPAPGSGDSVCNRADGEGAEGVDHVLPDRRDEGPRSVRHRLGAGQGVAGRHDQRVRRGLPRCAWDQGRVRKPGLLRQPREDLGHSQARGERAVVRGSDALGGQVPETGRPGNHRQRHRRRHRNRRFGAGDAGGDQPAERSGDPRALRQQVRVAVERDRSVRQVHRARPFAASSPGRPRRRPARPNGARWPAS